MTYNSVVLADSPQHYITFDQSTGTYTDSGSQNKTITVTGSPTRVSGISGTALQYNGTTDYVAINSPYDFGASTNFTFECWINTTANTNTPTMIRRDGGGAAYLLRLNAGKVEFYCNNGSIFTTAATYADGNWHHVVGVKSGTTSTLYVDGVQAATGTATTVAQASGGQPIYLGETTSSASEMYKGTLDEVAIYSTALSATRITAHYQAYAGVTTTPPAATMSLAAVNPVIAGTIINKTVTPPVATLSMSMPAPTWTQTLTYSHILSSDNSGASTLYTISPGGTGYTMTFPKPSYAGYTVSAASINIWNDTVSPPAVQISTAYGASGDADQSLSAIAYANIDVTKAIQALDSHGTANWPVTFSVNINSNFTAHVKTVNASTSQPTITVTYTALPATNVTVGAPAMALSLNAATAPVISTTSSPVVAVPPIGMNIDFPVPFVTPGTGTRIISPAMTANIDSPGGVPANPDCLSVVSGPMDVGISSPDATVSIQYPVAISSPAFDAGTIDMGQGVTIDLTTNVNIFPPAMTMNLATVGIYDPLHDRYLNKLAETVEDLDIWYKLDETSGTALADSAGAASTQGGSIHGTLVPVNDGPQLRHGIHFNGVDTWLVMGMYGDPVQNTTDWNTTNALTVEFSIRTTQTDGVVFIANGFVQRAQAGNGPEVNGNELRLEAGQLVIYETSIGKSVKVRKFIADGQWHHIVFSIPVDSAQPAFVMVDGDHALVRYSTFLGGSISFGGDWLPYTVMARQDGTGALAGDLSNFVVRNNNYVGIDEAESLYYEWSDANIINPGPMTASVEMPAPKVKGSVKKMLALYGLNFAIGHGAPAVGQLGDKLYEFLDVLTGMVIQNATGSINLANSTGGRYWQAPKSFMLNDYMVIPVSIFGNLYDATNFAQSIDGVLNEDASITPGGMFVNDETGHTRFINLQTDLASDVTEEFDCITVVNYPWEKQDDPAAGEYNHLIPYHDALGTMTEDQWDQARDDFRNSLLEAVYDGANLWIGDYYMAQHLGFIQGYDVHSYDRWDGGELGGGTNLVDGNTEALTLDKAHYPGAVAVAGTIGYYSYPQANFYRRIVNLVPGLTDIPGDDYGDVVEGWNVDDFLPNGSFLAYDIVQRPNGYQLDDRVSLLGSIWLGSKYWNQSSAVSTLSYPTARVAITSAHPDGIVGTVVSREQDTYYGKNGVVVQNPYKDNALTIAAEVGTILNGRPIGGRVFIELMSTEMGAGAIGEDADKNMWMGNEQPTPTSTWAYDSRRGKDVKVTLASNSVKFDASSGTFAVFQKTFEYLIYTSGPVTYHTYTPITYRGLQWVSEAVKVPAGDARVYANAMELALTQPNPTLSKTSSPAIQAKAMRLDIEMEVPANYSFGNVEVRVLPAEMDLEMRGIGNVIKPAPFTLSLTAVAPKLDVAADTVTVYLDTDRNITVFLKEDN